MITWLGFRLKVFVKDICLGYALTISNKGLPYPFDHPLPLLSTESGQFVVGQCSGYFLVRELLGQLNKHTKNVLLPHVVGMHYRATNAC